MGPYYDDVTPKYSEGDPPTANGAAGCPPSTRAAMASQAATFSRCNNSGAAFLLRPEHLHLCQEALPNIDLPAPASIQARWHVLQAFRNSPVQVLSAAVKLLDVPDFQRVTIDQEISNYHMNLAACERLLGQPIPVAYTRHTSRYSLLVEEGLSAALANIAFRSYYSGTVLKAPRACTR